MLVYNICRHGHYDCYLTEDSVHNTELFVDLFYIYLTLRCGIFTSVVPENPNVTVNFFY
jgi:hypothetical protein